MRFLTADCGGTRIKLGLVADSLVVAMKVIESCPTRSIAGTVEIIALCFESLCQEAGWLISDCEAMLLALPVIVSPHTNRVTATFGKFDDSVGFEFEHWAQQRLGLRLMLENDARAAVLGEWSHGAGKGVENLVMVTLGTGIGTAVICEGSPLRGRNGMAGILGGHTITHFGGAKCGCGAEGCLEAQISSRAMVDFARGQPDFDSSPLARERVLDYEAISRHAAEGDPLALKIWQRALEGWAALLINLIHGYDPERIVIGGGIMSNSDAILPRLQSIVGRQATQPFGSVEIVSSKLGDSAALLGAAWLWNRRISKAA